MEKASPLKIMIVDDDPDDLEYLRFIFDRNNDFEVTACLEDGASALQHISDSHTPPDVLLVDMYMPLMNGTEVVDKLSEMANAANLKAFIISTTINKDAQEKLRHNESVKFLEKPTNLVEMNDLPHVILATLKRPSSNIV